jgi:predicted transcriptional regulator
MNRIREYFERDIRRRCLSISAIEREAGVPPKTLAHFLKGRRKLNAGHVEKIKKVLMYLGLDGAE